MRKLKIFSFFLLITIFINCSHESTKQKTNDERTESDSVNLTIIVCKMSSSYGSKFILNDDVLSIINMGELTGEFDTTIVLSDSQRTYVVDQLADFQIENLKANYVNKCIKDGTQITVSISINNKSKSIHLSNYYRDEIGFLFELVNGLIPPKYQYFYDKERLLQLQRECED